jgi:2-keto-4-pentenoate hydratase/2-oxohepta-3-ene-1,7-dioic acid hydratase in catechol pathway
VRLARLRLGTETVLARVDGNKAIPLIVDTGDAWFDPVRVWLDQGRPETRGGIVSLSEADVLSPVRAPSKIVAVGLNYINHAKEQGRELPTAPMFFSKAPTSIIGPNEAITFSSAMTQQADYENELAVVIAERTRNVSEADALDYVLGYTICNDVSARDAQRSDGQFFRAKSFDTFCPIGPFIVCTDEIHDPQVLNVKTTVNGEERQNDSTANMIHSVAKIISYASTYFTLEPGDVIITGTPAGVGEARQPQAFLKDGDTVRCEIDGLGVLENPVRVS